MLKLSITALAIIGASAFIQPALAQSCIDSGKLSNDVTKWTCPAKAKLKPVLGKPKSYLTSRQRCEDQCTGASTGIEPTYVSNASWRKAFQKGKFQSGEAYTSFVATFDNNLEIDSTCENFGLSNAFFKRLFEKHDTTEAILTLAISQTSRVQSQTFARPGYTIPLLKTRLNENGEGCEFIEIENRNLTIARVRADEPGVGPDLRIGLGFVFTEERGAFSELGKANGNSVIGTALNGTLDPYRNVLAAVLGNNGLNVRNRIELYEETSLPIFPTADINKEEAVKFTVGLGGKEVIKVEIKQSPNISSVGSLADADTYSEALAKGRVVARDGDALTLGASTLREAIAAEAGITALPIGSTDMNLYKDFCNGMREKMIDWEFSKTASERLMALTMSNHPNPNIFETPEYSNLCLTQAERKKAKNIAIIRANRSTESCTPKRDWMDTTLPVAKVVIEQNYDELSKSGELSIDRNFEFSGSLASFIDSQKDRFEDSGSSCYLAEADYGLANDSKSCFFYFRTTGNETSKNNWVRARVVKSSTSILPLVSDITIFSKLDEYIDIDKAVATNTQQKCKRRIAEHDAKVAN